MKLIKRIERWFLFVLHMIADSRIVSNTSGMAFDLMRIIFMVISILLGNFVGIYISGFIGMTGALIGAFIVGLVIYYVYSMLSGQPTALMGAVIFAMLNYVSTLITGVVGSMTSLAGGIVTLLIQALILSMLWGWFGSKGQSGVKTGIET